MFLPRCFLAPAAIALLALASTARAEPTLTYAELIHRMTDLSRLAELPDVGEKCGQCSSYDRASRYDEKTGKYVNWAANGDGDGIIRREGDRVVMAEMKGPGCIWRIWSAAAGKGHVRIFLDDQPEPVVDLPFIDYFDGQHAPFPYPALSYDMTKTGSAGQDLYLPIPYQKSCKVVADKDWGAYYHFTYATYPQEPSCPPSARAGRSSTPGCSKPWIASSPKRLGTDPAGKRPGQETLAQVGSRRAGRDGPRGPARRSAGDHRPLGEDQLHQSGRRNGRSAEDGPADHLGRPGEAGGLVPAGRFLRHGARA